MFQKALPGFPPGKSPVGIKFGAFGGRDANEATFG